MSEITLVAQMGNNPLAMQKAWVLSLDLQEGMVTHASILAWRVPMDRRA